MADLLGKYLNCFKIQIRIRKIPSEPEPPKRPPTLDIFIMINVMQLLGLYVITVGYSLNLFDCFQAFYMNLKCGVNMHMRMPMMVLVWAFFMTKLLGDKMETMFWGMWANVTIVSTIVLIVDYVLTIVCQVCDESMETYKILYAVVMTVTPFFVGAKYYYERCIKPPSAQNNVPSGISVF